MARGGYRKGDGTACCELCAYSYEPHEIGADGKPFLVRCEFSRFSKFLDETCRKFKMKKDGNTNMGR